MSLPRRVRLAWAVSGQGRALQAVLRAIDAGLLPVELALVVTDRPSPIEAVAQERGIGTARIPAGPGPYHPDLIEALHHHGVEWMGLTFNRLLSSAVIDALEGRIFNLHLAPLPLFPGFGSIAKALGAGMRMTGATIHLVDAGMDEGTILAQAGCPIAGSDTPETLGRRLFEAALPSLLQVTRSIATGEISLEPEKGLHWQRAQVVPEGAHHVFPPVDSDLQRFAAAFCQDLRTGSG